MASKKFVQFLVSFALHAVVKPRRTKLPRWLHRHDRSLLNKADIVEKLKAGDACFGVSDDFMTRGMSLVGEQMPSITNEALGYSVLGCEPTDNSLDMTPALAIGVASVGITTQLAILARVFASDEDFKLPKQLKMLKAAAAANKATTQCEGIRTRGAIE